MISSVYSLDQESAFLFDLVGSIQLFFSYSYYFLKINLATPHHFYFYLLFEIELFEKDSLDFCLYFCSIYMK